jgi:hypothetical protein
MSRCRLCWLHLLLAAAASAGISPALNLLYSSFKPIPPSAPSSTSAFRDGVAGDKAEEGGLGVSECIKEGDMQEAGVREEEGGRAPLSET